jgi:aquaporin related protein
VNPFIEIIFSVLHKNKCFQYWLGPFLGSLLGTGIYIMLKQYVPNLVPLMLVNYPINSFRYWRLNPDQATSDPNKSPPDPLAGLMATGEDDSNFANEKRDAESSNGQLVLGDKGGAVGRGKNVEERIRCNDSVA